MGFPLRGVEPGVQQGHTYLARSTGRCEPALRTSPGWSSRAVAGLTVDDVYRPSEFRGRMLDSFITAQLRVEAEASGRVRLYHLRTENGDHEIDPVAKRGPSLFAFEYKAGRSPARADARRLLWFRDHVAGDPFPRRCPVPHRAAPLRDRPRYRGRAGRRPMGAGSSVSRQVALRPVLRVHPSVTHVRGVSQLANPAPS